MRPLHDREKRKATQSMNKELEELVTGRDKITKTSKNAPKHHLAALQEAYKKNVYLSVDDRKELAKSTGLTDIQVIF